MFQRPVFLQLLFFFIVTAFEVLFLILPKDGEGSGTATDQSKKFFSELKKKQSEININLTGVL